MRQHIHAHGFNTDQYSSLIITKTREHPTRGIITKKVFTFACTRSAILYFGLGLKYYSNITCPLLDQEVQLWSKCAGLGFEPRTQSSFLTNIRRKRKKSISSRKRSHVSKIRCKLSTEVDGRGECLTQRALKNQARTAHFRIMWYHSTIVFFDEPSWRLSAKGHSSVEAPAQMYKKTIPFFEMFLIENQWSVQCHLLDILSTENGGKNEGIKVHVLKTRSIRKRPKINNIKICCTSWSVYINKILVLL